VNSLFRPMYRLVYGFWAAIVTRAAYVFMRLSEPWTPYVRVHGLRLLPCNNCPEVGIEHMRRTLETLHAQDPAAMAALPTQLRYLSTVDGEREWPYQHISEMRTLRWSMRYAETAPLEDRLALLRRIASTGRA
jgi:hypothetical protein